MSVSGGCHVDPSRPAHMNEHRRKHPLVDSAQKRKVIGSWPEKCALGDKLRKLNTRALKGKQWFFVLLFCLVCFNLTGWIKLSKARMPITVFCFKANCFSFVRIYLLQGTYLRLKKIKQQQQHSYFSQDKKDFLWRANWFYCLRHCLR